MQSVLFLCHRLPWPPSKGDKIRSYHVLQRLLQHYRVYLGTFVDDRADWQYLPAIEAACAGTCVRPLPPRVLWMALPLLLPAALPAKHAYSHRGSSCCAWMRKCAHPFRPKNPRRLQPVCFRCCRGGRL